MMSICLCKTEHTADIHTKKDYLDNEIHSQHDDNFDSKIKKKLFIYLFARKKIALNI